MLHTCQRDRYKFLNEGRGFIGKWAFITRFVKKKPAGLKWIAKYLFAFRVYIEGKSSLKYVSIAARLSKMTGMHMYMFRPKW